MPIARLHTPFDHSNWLFELKYDGFRSLAYIEAGTARPVSRRDNTYKSFQNLCASVAAALPVENAVLDGEIVHLDCHGKPEFYDLLRRRSAQQFVAFDLLGLNGRDLRNLPLIERKRRLRAIVPDESRAVDDVFRAFEEPWRRNRGRRTIKPPAILAKQDTCPIPLKQGE